MLKENVPRWNVPGENILQIWRQNKCLKQQKWENLWPADLHTKKYNRKIFRLKEKDPRWKLRRVQKKAKQIDYIMGLIAYVEEKWMASAVPGMVCYNMCEGV